jgi:hypothetical protein
MTRRLRMQELWNQFRVLVIHKDAPDDQLREMRRAFYAGADAIFNKVIFGLTPGEEPQPEDIQVLSDLKSELEDFATAVKRGAA